MGTVTLAGLARANERFVVIAHAPALHWYWQQLTQAVKSGPAYVWEAALRYSARQEPK